MRDIRRLEKETQLILKKKLGRVAEDQELEEEEEEEEDEEEELVKRGEGSGEDVEKEKRGEVEEVESNKTVTEDPQSSTPVPSHLPPISPVGMQRSASDVPSGQEVTARSVLHLPMVRKGSLPIGKKRDSRRDRTGTQGSGRSMQHRRSDGLLPVSRSHSKVEGDSDGESMYSARPEWALDSIAISESDSELEFFDAIGERGRLLSF